MQQPWVSAGRAVCELGIRTLRDEIAEDAELGREPLVIAAHTALVVALESLDQLGRRPEAAALTAAHDELGRAQQAVAQARAFIDQVRRQRAGERFA